MSLSRRIAMLFRARANKALDRAEDPRELLDSTYERQLDAAGRDRQRVRALVRWPARGRRS